MANTTSGTHTFDKTFSIDQIIEEAFERLGIQNVTGYQLKSSRRSLNIMLQEWGNRGIHYWEIADTNIDLIEGQSEYKFFRASSDGTSATTTPTNGIYGMSDVLEAQFWVQRFIDHVSISIYPTPDSTRASKDMHIYYIKRIQDAGAYTNATDLPFRFVPCMVSGLAYYLSMKYAPQLIQPMKLVYEEEFQRALSEDGSDSSTHISPKTYYPGT